MNRASFNSNHAHLKQNTAIAIEVEVPIWTEQEELMVNVNSVTGRIYIIVTAMNDEDEENEEEMRNAVQQLKREEAQANKEYQARKTTSIKLKAEGHINDEESKQLGYSTRKTHQEQMRKLRTKDLMKFRTPCLRFKP